MWVSGSASVSTGQCVHVFEESFALTSKITILLISFQVRNACQVAKPQRYYLDTYSYLPVSPSGFQFYMPYPYH